MIVLAIVSAWLFAQLVKVVVSSIRAGQFEWEVVFFAGGFPSVHSTLVSALAASVWFEQGLSVLFVATVVFGAIVAYDAMTLRRSVKEHASLLRRLFKERDEKVLTKSGGIGHNVSEVVAGIVIGVVVPAVVYLF